MRKVYCSILSYILAGVLAVILLVPSFEPLTVNAAEPEVRANISDTANPGNIIIGVEGRDVTSAQQTLIETINTARKEACDNGYPDPRNPSKKLTSSDYKEIKLGVNCMRAAQIRACEAALNMEHMRPTGEECLLILKTLNSGNMWRAENLAWDSNDGSSIDLWINEKNAYLGYESGQTGHYATLINPDYLYTGTATFNPVNDSQEYDWACTAGQYASVDTAVESLDAAKNEIVIQKIEVPVSSVKGTDIPGDTLLYNGGEDDLKLLVKVGFSTAVASNSVINCQVYNGVTWSSDAPDKISVDSTGHIKALSEGSATITATIGAGADKKDVKKKYLVVDSSVIPTGVDDPDTITVDSNTKPELASTVKANLSNGNKADVSVAWDDYDESKLLTCFQSSDFDITGKAAGYNVVQKIHVKAAEMTGTYTNPTSITTDYNVEPVYPKAIVSMSNGYAYQDVNVIWNEECLEYYKTKEGGTFTVKGVTEYTFPTDDGGKQFPVEMTLVVKPDPAYAPLPDPDDGEGTEPGGGSSPAPGGSETPGSGGSEVPGSDNSSGSSSSGGNTSDANVSSGNDTGSEGGKASNSSGNESVVVSGTEKEVGSVSYVVTSVNDSDNIGFAGEVTYKAVNKTGASVSVPAQVTIGGKQYKVTSIDNNAFKNNKKIKKITIGKYVTKIGANAFYNCKNLKQITFKGTSVKTIGKNAFKGVPAKAKAKAPKKVLKKYKTLMKKAKYKGKLS